MAMKKKIKRLTKRQDDLEKALRKLRPRRLRKRLGLHK
jgi:hypothetical protein